MRVDFRGPRGGRAPHITKERNGCHRGHPMVKRKCSAHWRFSQSSKNLPPNLGVPRLLVRTTSHDSCLPPFPALGEQVGSDSESGDSSGCLGCAFNAMPRSACSCHFWVLSQCPGILLLSEVCATFLKQKNCCKNTVERTEALSFPHWDYPGSEILLISLLITQSCLQF